MTEELSGKRDEVSYDPTQASLSVATGGKQISVSGLSPEVVFQRLSPDGPVQWALFATAEELEVLGKMVAYILDKVRVSDSSRAALIALLPRVEDLREEVAPETLDAGR